MIMNKEQPTSAEGAAPEISREAVAIDPGLRSSKRHAWFGQEIFMNLYNIKYHALNLAYYMSIVTRGLLLVVLAPLNFIIEALYTVVSEWEPSKPLHKSSGDDIDYDKHLGI